MTAIWKVLIDWDRNGDFSGTHDDITARVIHANWFLVFRKLWMEMADNNVKRYTPESFSNSLAGKVQTLRPVKITSDDGPTERMHFMGWLPPPYAAACRSPRGTSASAASRAY